MWAGSCDSYACAPNEYLCCLGLKIWWIIKQVGESRVALTSWRQTQHFVSRGVRYFLFEGSDVTAHIYRGKKRRWLLCKSKTPEKLDKKEYNSDIFNTFIGFILFTRCCVRWLATMNKSEWCYVSIHMYGSMLPCELKHNQSPHRAIDHMH